MGNDKSMKFRGLSNSQKRKCKHKHSSRIRDDASVVFIDEDKDVPLPIVEKSHELKKQEKNKRQVQLGVDCGGVRDLRITQNFKIKQNENQCVINIKTNITKNYSDVFTLRRNTLNKTLFSCYPPKERILPKCTRKECKHCCRHKKVQHSCNLDKNFNHNCKNKNSGKKAVDKKTSSASKHKNERCSYRKHKRLSSLSSISSNPLSDLHESISTDSFESCTDLDSLIKRTKERDKKKSFKFSKQDRSYTPIDDASTIRSTDINTSIHSLATVVLDPIDNSAYSPTNSCGYLTDNDIFGYCHEFDNKSNSVSKELGIKDDLELAEKSITPVINEPSLPFYVNKQLKLEVSKLKIDQSDDYVINTSSIKQIKEEYIDVKEEYIDDMYLINDSNNDDEDYILWDDDGLIEDDIKVKEETF